MNDINDFYILMLTAYLPIAPCHSTEGEILRTMNIRDGYAMKAAESGYNVCIISGGSNEGVRVRLRKFRYYRYSFRNTRQGGNI
jgi:3-deoxy-D-manno-octulosonate 8-phosphate phosphatase (KDO 8-P phosphatase)